MKVLLDTATFLWVTLDDPRLSDRARTVFEDPSNEVFLSAVSAWEIAVKHALGRLPLPSAPAEFVPAQRVAHDISTLALDERAALRLAELPSLHRDPFDRMLVCQAIENDLVILTSDAAVRAYAVTTEW
jgi:PIN domain nuclease of toxin-antitoxin system